MSAHLLPHLAQRLLNVPLAILPDKAEVIMAVLADRLGVAHMFHADGGPVHLAPPEPDDEPAEYRAYDVIAGVAVIPIRGTLIQESNCLRPYSGMTGYDGIRTGFLQALYDPAVDAIVLDINSPGGEVAGCLDLADTIFAARGLDVGGKVRPIWAILSESAYSAGYALACAADHVTVPRTGGVGSVGIIAMHCDLSKALSAAGVTVTVITYGARKADGVECAPLSKDAFARIQHEIDLMGDLFVATVARNRRLSPEAVRATEAAIYPGAEGIAIGFADEVLAPDAAFAALLATL